LDNIAAWAGARRKGIRAGLAKAQSAMSRNPVGAIRCAIAPGDESRQAAIETRSFGGKALATVSIASGCYIYCLN
jgi:hypothetical protein